MKKLLLIVDPQYDFLDEGSLPVKGSTERMRKLSQYIPKSDYNTVVITVDWHPSAHSSFKENGGEWNRHCVQYTSGACVYNPLLNAIQEFYSNTHLVLTKGLDTETEEYSIFGSKKSGGRLLQLIQDENIEQIDVCGIVSTVCVKNTINDLVKNGLGDKTNVLIDFTASFNEESEREFIKWLDENRISH